MLLALIEKNVVAFPFKMQAFASHGCLCSDHVSGVLLLNFSRYEYCCLGLV